MQDSALFEPRDARSSNYPIQGVTSLLRELRTPKCRTQYRRKRDRWRCQVTPAAMGFAVTSSTMGMAVAGLAVSLFSERINRRLGILISLSILSIPTALLAVAPDLTTFTALRITQGLCMASAFTLTLAYLGEECSAADAGGAFAAYITGNVA